jgi:hypothetical protein
MKNCARKPAGSHFFAATFAGAMLVLTACLALAADQPWDPDKYLNDLKGEIARNGWDWTAGHTGVSDLSPEQRQAMLGYRPMPESERAARSLGELVPLDAKDIPASWDWRTLGGMTGVRNQGSCGSCWAFGATGAFESSIKIFRHIDTNLSEQQMLVCNDMGCTCAGGNSEACYFLMESMGQVSEVSMPYTGNDAAPCVDSQYDSVERIQGYVMVPANATSLKTAIMTAPICVNLYAPNALFNYSGGCFQYTGSGATNHCVVMCGWDDAACGGAGAWLFKNSWGSGWGEGGYCWMRYGQCSLGQGAALISYTPTPDVRLGYDAHAVLGGNGNASLDAGETANLRITLRNYGRGPATGVSATLVSSDPAITVTGATASYASINAWEMGTSSAPDFAVQVAPGASGEHQLTLQITSAGTPTQTSSFPIFIGPTILVYGEGFETSDGSWTHGGTTDDWRRATPSTKYGKPDPVKAGVGQKCFGNDLTETTSWNTLYENSANNYIESPTINCSGKTGVHLYLRRWVSCEEALYDHANLKVNGTTLWTNETNGFHLDTMWEPVLYDISAIADNNPSVRIRFELTSDEGVKFGGWGIDDIRVFVPDALVDVAQEESLTPRALALQAFPNPANPVTNLRLSLPVAGIPALRVFDATGRCVRTLAAGEMPVGVHHLAWNGNDDAGRRVPGGIYYVKAEIAGREVVSRLVLLR